MFDKKKIRILSALALYDKYNGYKDKEITVNKKGSYIYKKNCLIRIGIFVGFVILLGFYTIDFIFIKEIDFSSFNIMLEAKKMGGILIFALIIYTVIGTYINGRDYDTAEERVDSYYSLLDKMDEFNEDDMKGN